jgi:hypothetical protein
MSILNAHSSSRFTIPLILFFFALTASAQTTPNIPWDYTGIIGTGQSLSIGARAMPVVLTTQPFDNLKLWTGDLAWPVDPNDAHLQLVPLTEPVGRFARSYPSSWPQNIGGETWHSAMGNQVTALVRQQFNRDYVTVHTEVGEDGQGMVFLKKNPEIRGLNGRSYAAAMISAKAIERLAKASGKTFGIGAIIVTHGEADAGNADYELRLHQLWQDYNADLKQITGQTQTIPMILSQQNSVLDRAASTRTQWKIGQDDPADFVCSGPKYQYPSFEGVHLTSVGYEQLGEKYGEVYFQRGVLGKPWEPLAATGAVRNGATVTVHFHVPVEPLVWEADFQPPHPSAPQWKDGKGFEVTAADGRRIKILSAEISGDDVVLTCDSDPGPAARIAYATIGEKERMAQPFKGMRRWGLLRDSDPFVGSTTSKPQPNFALAFEMAVE